MRYRHLLSILFLSLLVLVALADLALDLGVFQRRLDELLVLRGCMAGIGG